MSNLLRTLKSEQRQRKKPSPEHRRRAVGCLEPAAPLGRARRETKRRTMHGVWTRHTEVREEATVSGLRSRKGGPYKPHALAETMDFLWVSPFFLSPGIRQPHGRSSARQGLELPGGESCSLTRGTMVPNCRQNPPCFVSFSSTCLAPETGTVCEVCEVCGEQGNKGHECLDKERKGQGVILGR